MTKTQIARLALRFSFFVIVSVAASPQPQMNQKEVVISVLVSDRNDIPVSGLTANDFNIFDGGVPQVINHFSFKDGLVSAVIIVDTSKSRRDHVTQAKQEAVAFIQALGTGDEVLVLGLGDSTKAAGFTLNLDLARQQVIDLKPIGPTPLFDTLAYAIDQVGRRGHDRRKVLLVNSDGDDDTSSRGPDQVEPSLGRSDILMFAVGPPNISDSGGRRNPLIEFTRLTGGRYFTDGTASIGSKVGRTLRERYSLGYQPSQPGKGGKYRKLRVEVRSPGASTSVKVVTRPGYYP